MKYQLIFTVTTEADQSLLLEMITEMAESFEDELESMHDQTCTVELEGEHSPMVAEVSS